MRPPEPHRGDIFSANLGPVTGSEQGGIRPVLVLQNDVGNRHAPTVIVAAISAQVHKARLPVHVTILLPDPEAGIHHPSVILLEQIRTIDKRRLGRRIGHLGPDVMGQVDRALQTSLGIREVAS